MIGEKFYTVTVKLSHDLANPLPLEIRIWDRPYFLIRTEPRVLFFNCFLFKGHILKWSLGSTATPDLKLLVIDATGISPYPMCHELSSADILAIGVSKCTLDLLLNDPLKLFRLSPD